MRMSRIIENNRGKIGKGFLFMLVLFAAGLSSCNKSQSYSELLREEEKVVNIFLSDQKVMLDIPADSISFEIGPDAPFYRMDEDGYLYMNVISKGDMTDRPESGDVVYIRYERENLKYKYLYGESVLECNQNGFANEYNKSASFVYKNTYLESTTALGTGIQWPMKFFGYNCEVNLVLRSYYGFSEDQVYCNPYLINVKYFKPEY